MSLGGDNLSIPGRRANRPLPAKLTAWWAGTLERRIDSPFGGDWLSYYVKEDEMPQDEMRNACGERQLSLFSRYLRLIDSKVVSVTEQEVMQEEELAIPDEWARLIHEANTIKERAGYLHQAMRDDSQFENDYRLLWFEYQEIVYQLREINPQAIVQFRDKVVTRIKELEIRLNTMCDAWNPVDFEDFEELLALYEKNCDLMEAL